MAGLRKSLTARALAGTLRRDRLRHAGGVLLRCLPRAPKRLSSSSARQGWYRLGRAAISAGTLQSCDLELLALAAEAAGTAAEAQKILSVGVIVESRGSAKAHPALHVLRDSRSLLLRCLLELGLSPRSRESVSTPLPRLPAAPEDPAVIDDADSLEAYLASRPPSPPQ